MAARPRPVKPPRKKLEKEIESACRVLAISIGWAFVKFVSPGNPGVPDRMLLSPRGGKTIFVELKRPGEVPTPVQLAWHKVLGRRGFEVWVIDSFEHFKDSLLRTNY